MANKYVYKKSVFKWIDMLKAKKLPFKVLKGIKKLSNENIKTNYHVNDLANKLHPFYIQTVVTKINRLNHEYILIRLERQDKSPMPFFRAGQYITLNFNINGVRITRPYSISSSPYQATRENFYEIIIKKSENGFISNLVYDEVDLGNEILIQGPFGDFYHDNLRDCKHVICITRGVGITPFLSMIKAIHEGSEDFKITLIVSSGNSSDLVSLETIKDINNEKVKIIVINNNGPITSKIIQENYIGLNNSIFLCGSKSLYRRTYDVIQELNLRKKFIRYEKTNQIGKPIDYDSYKNVGQKSVYKIKVNQKGKVYEIDGNFYETILVSLQKAKITSNSNCLRGVCGWCRFKLISGSVFTPKENIEPRKADLDSNVYFTCSTFPTDDIEIEVY